MSQRPTLVLASGSPRRRDLLRLLDLEFVTRPVPLEETRRADESPRDMVLRLAEEKARFQGGTGELILGADTIVLLDRAVLGKPADPEKARRMLQRLAGRRHVVLTGVALFEPGANRLATDVAQTEVRIAPLSEAEITRYVATGEPLDKAGAYAVQGLGAMFVEEIEGNYFNVVGLPIRLVHDLFRRLGYEMWDFRKEGGS